jgi:hypothetical protein
MTLARGTRLNDAPPEILLAVAIFATVVALVQTARIVFARAATRRQLRMRMDHAADGEARAESLLVSQGFTVLGRQVSTSYDVIVDGSAAATALRADYLVTLGARTFIAEVKTGRSAPRVETPATRRQLLEYRIAFDVDGVLLVDVDAHRIRTVVFPFETQGRGPHEFEISRAALSSRTICFAFLLCGACCAIAGAAASTIAGNILH